MRSNDCRITTSLSLFALAAVALLSVDRSAGGGKSQQSKSQAGANDNFARADANHDGKLSREEAGDYLVYEVFTACDTNHDGRISLKEWLRVKPGETAAFKERDGNSDGFVTLAE